MGEDGKLNQTLNEVEVTDARPHNEVPSGNGMDALMLNHSIVRLGNAEMPGDYRNDAISIDVRRYHPVQERLTKTGVDVVTETMGVQHYWISRKYFLQSESNLLKCCVCYWLQVEKKIMKHCHLPLMMLTHLRFLPRASHLEMLGHYVEVAAVGCVGFDQDHLKRALEKKGFHTKL